jgi:hypothetical protein
MPISIPPDVLPILESLGIKDPAHNRWRRLEPWPARRIRAHCYCECAFPVTRVELAHTWLGGRRVFIGQCFKCGLVNWRDAVSE